MVNKLPLNMSWLGHASFVIDEGSVIYIDPYKLDESSGLKPADIILITHNHFDHFSPEDIAKVAHKDTTIIASLDCSLDNFPIEHIKPGEKRQVGNVLIEAVPAYNIDKEFHPKQNNWLGYIITVNEIRLYHAGDTDIIPEMENITADIVLLPVGGTYTMDAEDAAELIKKLNPKIAIPMHYGSVVGKVSDADEFEELCECQIYRFD